MGMPQTAETWTAERIRALPDDRLRHEVVDGEHLVTPAPRLVHQRAVDLFRVALRSYVAANALGECFSSPSDVELDPWTLVQPDLFVTARRRAKDWSEILPLRLAVEVLSPSTARADRFVKRRRFQKAGIPEYWIVDLDARLVERWRPGDVRPEVLAEKLEWQPEPSLPPLVLDLVALFREVHAEE
jgi:Uma2 family endonuclease